MSPVISKRRRSELISISGIGKDGCQIWGVWRLGVNSHPIFCTKLLSRLSVLVNEPWSISPQFLSLLAHFWWHSQLTLRQKFVNNSIEVDKKKQWTTDRDCRAYFWVWRFFRRIISRYDIMHECFVIVSLIRKLQANVYMNFFPLFNFLRSQLLLQVIWQIKVEIYQTMVIFNWLTTTLESSKPFVILIWTITNWNVSMEVFRSFTQNFTLYSCSRKLHIAIIATNTKTPCTQIKWDANNPKESGYLGSYDEHSVASH